MHTKVDVPTHEDSRRAASLLFAVDGVGFGVWAALLPSLQLRLNIGDGELSGILFAMVVGAMVAMNIMGRVVARFGSAATLRWLAPLFSAVLCGPALAPNYLTVAVAAAFFGAMKGSLDVAVNSHAMVVEKAMGRPILSSFQAWWSFGGLGAAGLTGLALKSGLSPLHITVAVAAILLAVSIWFSKRLLKDVLYASEEIQDRAGFNPQLWPIGLLAFASLFAEGVMIDWSSIYSQRVAGAATWLAPLAYGVFSMAMGAGRLLGDGWIARSSPEIVLRRSGWLAFGGLGVVALVPFWPVTFCGLIAVGFGISNLVPIFLGSASRIQPGAVARAVATVIMIGYVGFLVGPPVVGMLSHWVGLSAAFAFVALMMAGISLGGPALLRGGPEAVKKASKASMKAEPVYECQT